jgi:hypothetical protein
MIHREIVTIHRRKVSILQEMTLNLSEIVLISPAFITSKLYVICGKKGFNERSILNISKAVFLIILSLRSPLWNKWVDYTW